MRTLTLILLLTFAAHAQIQGLATTSDGAQLYFSTTLRLKGADLRENSKILRYLDGNFELFAYVKPEQVLSFYCCDLTRPQVSGNGQTVAYSSIRSCFGGSTCFDFNPNSAQIRGTYNKSFLDSIILSPDGRYVVVNHSYRTDRHTSIVDNASGVETRLGSSPDYAPIGGSQSIATDGTVLVSVGGIASLWKSGAIKSLGFGNSEQARLSANGSVVVYRTLDGDLISHDVPSGRRLVLAHPSTPSTSLSVSSDGTLVAYLDLAADGTVQAFLQPTGGAVNGGRRILTSEKTGVSEVVLSGFGNIAYAVGDAGRLLKIDVAGAVVTELAKVPPALYTNESRVAPGTLFVIPRKAIPPEASGVSINGLQAPVINENPETIMFQVPWEIAGATKASFSPTGFTSPFEDARDKFVLTGFPDFFFLSRGPTIEYVLALHEDFSGVVSVAKPARPGEIIHVYLTGLGLVSPPVATGEITPAGTPHSANAKIECKIDFKPADILFAGLAPGFVGLNQLDVRMPATLSRNDPSLDCRIFQESCASCTNGGYGKIAAQQE